MSRVKAQQELDNLDALVRISRKDEQLRDPYVLHDLCLRRELDLLFELLELRKHDVDGRNQNGLTPLHVSVVSAGPPYLQDLINYLLYYRADVDARCTPDGNTSLHLAIIYSRLSNAEISVPLLLREGAVPNLRNYADRTPKDYAYAKGYDDLAALLDAIEKDPSRRREIDVDNWKATFGAGGRDYKRLLQQAIEKGDAEAVSDLLYRMNAAAGASDDGARDLMCYHLAVEKAQRNKVEVIESLAYSGADASKVDTNGNTPIHLAVESLEHNNEMLEVIKALLNAKVPKAAKNKQNKDALALATEHGYKDVEDLLSDPKPKPPPPPPPSPPPAPPPKAREPQQPQPESRGTRQFIHDVLNDKKLTSKQKLQELERLWASNPNTNPNVRSTDGADDTPLHVTVRRDLEPLVDFFISKNAMVNVKNKHGETPLMLAQQTEFGFSMSAYEKLKEASRRQVAQKRWAQMGQRMDNS